MQDITSLFRTNNAKSAYLEFQKDEDGVLVFRWKNGFASTEEIINGHKKSLEIIKKHDITALVEDTTDFSGPFQEAFPYFIQEYAPAIKSMGIDMVGVVLNKNLFSTLSVDMLKDNPDFKKVGISYRPFGSFEDVKAWIKSEGKVPV